MVDYLRRERNKERTAVTVDEPEYIVVVTLKLFHTSGIHERVGALLGRTLGRRRVRQGVPGNVRIARPQAVFPIEQPAHVECQRKAPVVVGGAGRNARWRGGASPAWSGVGTR